MKDWLFVLSLAIPFKFEIVFFIPSKYSLPLSKIFLNKYFKKINIIIQKQTLKGFGLENDLKEIMYEISSLLKIWLFFIPLKSYIKCRKLLYLGYKRLIIEKQDVVDIL